MQVIEGMDEQVSRDRPPAETPKPTQVMKDDLEERVAIWATVPKGDNEFETIFKLRGHRILEALRYQFTSMAPKSYIDIQVVTLMCHVLNADEDERFEKLVYCIPPEILQRMFATHNYNWMDKKKRRPHEISSLLNHTEFLAYLDREKLNSHRFLFAPVLYSEHGWLYVLDKFSQEMFVLDSKNISSPSSERTELNKFASNILNQLLKWAGAPSILKKGSWSLLPTYINIPQQPNDFDCVVFVMKWMEMIDPTILAGPIYPTQEVIDISSSSEDEHEPQPNPIKIVFPKIEEGLVTSPSARLITEVLMSMGQDKGEEPEPNSPPDPSIQSFSLNLEWSTPLVTEEQFPTTLEEEFPLTARTMQVLEGMDEQVSGDRPPAETPKPTQL
ncbi:hypothetical protein PIB30_075683 [Stylosanthes scabra]|uniref:Ubiquitin-like protease family profile domain-containing protein n=1 Tax=Stylosanthes scabra TaxID=79078 RepID=A0ABU6RPW4_9FABA|nr:hypothetical protein [Stylosanthes scabra]